MQRQHHVKKGYESKPLHIRETDSSPVGGGAELSRREPRRLQAVWTRWELDPV